MTCIDALRNELRLQSAQRRREEIGASFRYDKFVGKIERTALVIREKPECLAVVFVAGLDRLTVLAD